MATVSSDVDVCNLALDMVKEGPIQALDENRAAARWMDRNYAPTRDFVLASFPWPFAVKRAELAVDATAPAFGWEHRYLLPNDCIRLLPPRYEGKLNGRLVPHEVEGKYILTDHAAPLRIKYISRVATVAEFADTPLFVEALAAKLAARISLWMTGKQSYTERAEAMFVEILKEARFMESSVGTPPDQYANAYDDARFTYADHNVKYGSSAAN